MITLRKLIQKNSFESYTIISGKNNLDKDVKSASVLETPDFSNYIIEHSLIITTFYPIQTNHELFKNLLYVLADKNSSGLVVKMNRYINEIPEDVVELSESLGIPIICLDYDANLSTIFNSIISEIQSDQLNLIGLNLQHSSLYQIINENPSTRVLVDSIQQISNHDILIFNVSKNSAHYSSQRILDSFNKHRDIIDTPIKDGNHLLNITNIEYDGILMYQLALLVDKDMQHLLYTNGEIYRLHIVYIIQRKRELMMRQNQFLLSFVTNITSSSSSNSELIETSKFYAWDIEFPIVLVLFSFKNLSNNEIINATQALNMLFIDRTGLSKSALRYVFIDSFVLFILNTSNDNDNATLMNEIYEGMKEIFEDIELKIAYSNPLHNARDIPQVFSILSETVRNSNIHMIDISVFNENHVRLIRLLKSLDQSELAAFSKSIIGDIIEYENKNNLPLINTLYKYIQCHFSIKETAKALFLHPNSLKYRLSILEGFGYKISNSNNHFFDIYLALYVYINLLNKDSRS